LVAGSVAAGLVIALGAGSAQAAAPNALVYACFSKKQANGISAGYARIADAKGSPLKAGSSCRRDEFSTKMFWNAKGETGASGPKGDTGATGPKGDTGATGAKGDTGPKGDPGIGGAAGLAGIEVVSVSEPASGYNGTAGKIATATCPSGKVVIGGGGGHTFPPPNPNPPPPTVPPTPDPLAPASPQDLALVSSEPGTLVNGKPTSWTVRSSEIRQGGIYSLHATAICATAAP
jgi:hypothetical protein